ncbi:response regulator [Oscillatoria sp. FACHB-1407]|nr:response regulator [Oscillatoria sp. FACHB-1407]
MDGSALLESGLRVLVVDGDPDSRELLAILFQEYGVEIITASSVSESLTIIRQSRPDLLIAEIMLPDEDGYSLISQVKVFETTHCTTLPAIALTTCVSEGDRVLAAGFCRYLSKPIDLDELMATVACLTEQFKRG